jgi:FO synthase
VARHCRTRPQERGAGKLLVNRLAIYPAYVRAADKWLAPDIATRVRRMSDAKGFARDDDWAPGQHQAATGAAGARP